MAAELELLYLTQLEKLAQYQQPPVLQSPAATSWMWNPNQVAQEDDDSWEVRAFEQDTGNINGTTWPPRSYTCTFCRREFRSAQALGGHMNVHRRDRARLHQAHPGMNVNPTSSNIASSTFLIPAQEFVTNNGGLCLVYSLASPNAPSAPVNSCMDSPNSKLLSCPTNNLISPCPQTYTNNNYPATPHSLNSSICQSSNNTEPSASNNSNGNYEDKKDPAAIEELDLELRLGRR